MNPPKAPMYRIMNADTRQLVRNRYGRVAVVGRLYTLIEESPDADFLIVDADKNPVPVSRLV